MLQLAIAATLVQFEADASNAAAMLERFWMQRSIGTPVKSDKTACHPPQVRLQKLPSLQTTSSDQRSIASGLETLLHVHIVAIISDKHIRRHFMGIKADK